jgi:hypothetical protein
VKIEKRNYYDHGCKQDCDTILFHECAFLNESFEITQKVVNSGIHTRADW